ATLRPRSRPPGHERAAGSDRLRLRPAQGLAGLRLLAVPCPSGRRESPRGAAMITLRAIAFARSGDKGASANVAVFGRTPAAYAWLRAHLTADRVEAYFRPLGVGPVVRYDVPNLEALNFVL